MENLKIPVAQKLYALFILVHSSAKSVRKQDRYTVWQRLENSTLKSFELVIRAGSGSLDTRSTILHETSVEIDIIKFLIRISRDIKAIDQKQYIQLQSLVDEIGRMIGGWLKTTPKRK